MNFNIGSKLIEVPQTFGGETDFGRQCRNDSDFGSKLNFAFMLAENWDRANNEGFGLDEHLKHGWSPSFWEKHSAKEFTNCVQMVREVLLEKWPESAGIVINFADDPWNGEDEETKPSKYWLNNRSHETKQTYEHGYIDHGSNWWEQGGNMKIFESKETLKNFLFNRNSYIALQGDEYVPVYRELDKYQTATLEGDEASLYVNNASYLEAHLEDWE